MKTFISNHKSYLLPRTKENAAALVITLLVIVLFSTIVAGFLAATRLEQAASRNFTYQNIAEHMAQMAAQQAIAQLNRDVAPAILDPSSIATAPGAVFQNGNLTILSSAASPAATTASTNVNLISSLAGGGIIHSNTNANIFTVPLVDVANSMHGDEPYGRYSYWIDDDGSRANLNSMVDSESSSPRTNFIPNYPANSNPRSLDATIFPTIGGDLERGIIQFSSDTNSTNPWAYFVSPRQTFAIRGIAAVNARQMLTQVTAGPANFGNPWYYTNSDPQNPRMNLNRRLSPIAVGGLTLHRNFLMSADSSDDLTDELNSIVTEKIDRLDVTNRFESSFQQKYGRDVLRQIIVNMNDLHLASTSDSSTPLPTTGFANTNSDGIPTLYSGLRKFVHLNEVTARVAYNPSTFIFNRGPISYTSRCEIQIWVKFEIMNPFQSTMGNQTQIQFEVADFSATATYTLANGTVGSAEINRSTTPDLGPQEGILNVDQSVTGQGFLPTSGSSNTGNLTYALEYQFFQGNGTQNIPEDAVINSISNVSFTIRYAKLLQSADDPATVRDWAVTEDFSGHGSANGTLSFNSASIPAVTTRLLDSSGNTSNFQQPALTISDFNTGPVLGIAKNDPRVRTFPDWVNRPPSWFPVYGNANPRITLGAENSVVDFNASTGRAGVSPDRVSSAVNSIFSHPDFFNSSNASATSSENYKSVSDLGKVHTGLQWRTLNIASQNPTETASRLIPDWALLETFNVTNNFQTNIANPIVKLNLNSVHFPAASNLSIVNQSRAGLLRPLALESLLSAGTNRAAATNVGIPSGSVMGSGSTPGSIATNISQLIFNPNWASRRATLGATNFPTNAFTSIGEVLEINEVANFSSDDAVNEGRAASFIDAVSTHSDIFSIYSVGYALDRNGAIVAEFAMRTQVQYDPVSQQFQTVFAEPLR